MMSFKFKANVLLATQNDKKANFFWQQLHADSLWFHYQSHSFQCFTAVLNIAKAVKKQIKTSEKLSVVKQKDESRNVDNKIKQAKFSEKRTFFTP